MPGRKLPGKLEQLERAGASLLHNSRAAAAGRRGPSPALVRSSLPSPGQGAQRAEVGHQAPALRDPGTGEADPRPPGLRRVRRLRPTGARSSSRAHLDGASVSWLWAG